MAESTQADNHHDAKPGSSTQREILTKMTLTNGKKRTIIIRFRDQMTRA